MIHLLDVNIWIALADEKHVNHKPAQEYWEKNGNTEFAFCRITMLAFLRIATNPKAVTHPKTHAEIWENYEALMALPNIIFLPEPKNLDHHFRVLTAPESLVHRLWTDAYLAAFAIAGGHCLVSFDSDFNRFSGLKFLHLSA
jgi:uncharacterized protein